MLFFPQSWLMAKINQQTNANVSTIWKQKKTNVCRYTQIKYYTFKQKKKCKILSYFKVLKVTTGDVYLKEI